jgi:hypothetical protein
VIDGHVLSRRDLRLMSGLSPTLDLLCPRSQGVCNSELDLDFQSSRGWSPLL